MRSRKIQKSLKESLKKSWMMRMSRKEKEFVVVKILLEVAAPLGTGGWRLAGGHGVGRESSDGILGGGEKGRTPR